MDQTGRANECLDRVIEAVLRPCVAELLQQRTLLVCPVSRAFLGLECLKRSKLAISCVIWGFSCGSLPSLTSFK